MQRGMKPKPTQLKLIIGSSRIRRTKKPQPQGEARKPDWLDGTAAVIWQEYAPQLTELGLLRRLDTETFTGFCIQAARMRDDPSRMSPADFAQLRIFGEAFGMSPSSRSRIVLEEEKTSSKKAAMR